MQETSLCQKAHLTPSICDLIRNLIINPSPAEPGYVCPVFANSVDPDHLASEEAYWSGFSLFAIKFMNLYQQSGSSNLIGWNLEMGVVF